MSARAYLFDRVLRVDTRTRVITFTPLRWVGIVFTPCFAATPASLFYVEHVGRYSLTTGGWLIALGYAALTIFVGFMFLSPQNRRIVIDLHANRMKVGGVYGIGVALDEPLGNVKFTYEETARQVQGNLSYTGKLRAISGTRVLVVAHLANKAISIVQELARILPAAATGDAPSLERLESVTTDNGRNAGLKTIGLMILMLVPGAIFAGFYAR